MAFTYKDYRGQKVVVSGTAWGPDTTTMYEFMMSAIPFEDTTELAAPLGDEVLAISDVIILKNTASGDGKRHLRKVSASDDGSGILLSNGLYANYLSDGGIYSYRAGEINAIASKAIPVNADVIIIEDSADSFNKKKITLTDLLSAGSGDVVGPVSAVDVRLATFNGTSGKLIQDSGSTVASVLSRANHSGDQLAATISNFQVTVSANTDVTTNTAKVSNATHTGDVTGSTTLTIAVDSVTYAKMQNVVSDDVLLGNIAGAGGIVAEITPAQIRTMINVADGSTANNSNAYLLSRTNHTDSQLASTISNFQTTVSANTDVTANTAKVTNATHTGDVTGNGILTIAVGAVDIAMMSATGTPGPTTFYRGDNTWSVPAGGGDVSKVGTPVDNQLGVWTGPNTIEGDADLTFSTGTLSSKNINIAEQIDIPACTTSVLGVVYKNSVRFLHSFSHPTGDSAIPEGHNLFIGENCGNFTMGSTATSTGHASNNIGLGRFCFEDNTLGNENIALGNGTLRNNTVGYANSAFGTDSMFSNVGGHSNLGIGNQSLYSNLQGDYNVALGRNSLYYSTQHDNVAIGRDSGRYWANGSTALTGCDSSVYIGSKTKGLDNNDDNSIVIGFEAIGIGANSIVLGNSNITKTLLRGKVGVDSETPAEKLTVDSGSIIVDNDAGSAHIGFYSFDTLKWNIEVNSTTDADKMNYRKGTTTYGFWDSAGKFVIGTSSASAGFHCQVDAKYGSATDHISTTGSGKLDFGGAGGFNYAGVSLSDDFTVTITTQGVQAQVAYFDTEGPENTSSADGTNDKLVTAGPTGDYQVTLSGSWKTVTTNDQCSIYVSIDGGTTVIYPLQANDTLTQEFKPFSKTFLVNFEATKSLTVHAINIDSTDNIIFSKGTSLCMLKVGGTNT